MGVTGLWRLIEPAGKPVPVETLENKVLAVDISIWLHQMVKGYQDAKGAPLPNAHLMGLFQRLCKLLYFRIKPVFVFDGGFPDLKRETIAKRQDSKAKYHSESERIKRELALLLSKKSAIGNLLGKEISPKKVNKTNANTNDDLFKLPALPENKQEDESDSSSDEESSSSSIVDLHSVDIESSSFKSLPVKEKYDLLLELKETRKMNSWGRLDELPKKSDNFSDFQMQRLLKRRKVQECLEETEKEMGDGGMSLNELESLLNETGIDTKIEVLPTRRIASNDNTRFLLINNVKQALEAKKNMEQNKPSPGTSKDLETTDIKEEKPPIKDEFEDDLEKAIKMSLGEPLEEEEKILKVEKNEKVLKKDELAEDLEKAIKMSLECVDNHDTSNYTSKTDDSWTSILSDTDYSDNTDSEEGDGYEQPDMSSAKAYIMQYSDFTSRAIDKIISSKPATNKSKQKAPNLDQILEEINKKKSVILDKLNISSDEDCVNIEISNKIDDEKQSPEFERELTQESVLYVENQDPDTIILDTSGEESILMNNIASTRLSQKEVNSQKEAMLEDDMDTINSNKLPVKAEHDSGKDNYKTVSKEKKEINSIDSSSSEDEFEDVPEIESQNSRPVVQLTLDVGKMCKEDEDIFADVFTNKKTSTIETDSSTEISLANHESEGNNKIKTLKEPEDVCLKNEPGKDNTEKTNVLNVENPIDSSELQSIEEYVKNSNRAIEQIILSKHAANKNKPKAPNLDQILEEINKEKSVILDKLNNLTDEDCLKNTEQIRDAARGGDSLIISNVNVCDLSKEKDLEAAASTRSKIVAKEVISVPKNVISTEKLNEMAEAIANEEQDLVQEKGRLDRIGRNITEQMTKEAQELLQLFGIPYIVAPMEAEAQCAFLENVNLTDGTITDDSDIWLFGGRTVYKNFFNQKKHVLQFLSERIEKSYNLTREQLILLALLVGSDYTTGVDGVGPVTALEILASFPFNKKNFLNETSKQGKYQQIITGMQEFKQWVRAGKRTDNTSLKKKLRNVSLNDDFPSVRVVQAYLEPNVEKSEDKFTWGEIDITVLRDYTKTKFGWSQNKLDEIINPVLKRLQERKSQKTVHDYFKRKVDFQSLELQMSKRVKAAVQQMGPESNDKIETIESSEPIIEIAGKTSRKRKLNNDRVPKTKAQAAVAGPSRKVRITAKSETENLPNVNAVAHVKKTSSGIDIVIPKTDRFQEVIPQREKDKQCLLQNKMKAIEIFRKTKIDRKKKVTKRKVILPKDKADLSESSDED